MKKLLSIMLVIAAVFGTFACFASEGETKTVSGVLKVETNDDGAVTSAAIMTDDDEKIVVKLDAKGKELAKAAADKKVTVEGTVSESDDTTTITVKKFTVAAASSESSSDDSD